MLNALIFYKFINGDDMKTIKIALTSIFLVISSYASATTISANVALSSDYIWRGITQTSGDMALSGGFDLEAGNGFYFGTWASNASAGSASLELDVYLGFSGDMAENMTYNIGYISVEPIMTLSNIIVSDFTIGFYYYDYEDDATVAGGADEDGGYVSISRSF